MNDVLSKGAQGERSKRADRVRQNRCAHTRRMGGFTIVETMIVLAVTGVLLISAMYLIVGQQNKVQFNQSIQEVQSSIQQTINEVGAGFYPNSGNLRCNGSAGALVLNTGTTPQGSNTGCIFLGKAIQFGIRDVDPNEFIVHSIAGLDKSGGSLEGERSIADALPTAIARGQTTNATPVFDEINSSVTNRLLYGLEVVSMRYVQGSTPQPIGAVAFISGLGKYQGSQLMSGTQQISLVPVGGSTTNSNPTPDNPLSTTSEQVVDAINTNLRNPTVSPQNPDGGVEICFASGSTTQSGLITIGGNGRSLAVNLVIKSTKDCT